jgi:AraC family transcriptional regulator
MPAEFRFDQVQILDFPGVTVATLEHRGDPRQLGDSIRRFIEWRKRTGLHPRNSATYNILYDDLTTTAPIEFRFDLCAATDGEVALEPGIVLKEIPAGRCARLRVTGGDDAMSAAVRFLYSQWLPASGAELRDFPLFLQRVHFYPDVPEHEQVIDLFLPLAV